MLGSALRTKLGGGEEREGAESHVMTNGLRRLLVQLVPATVTEFLVTIRGDPIG
ncbi:aminobenzoyl-glutamate transporter [Cutibacterium avidum ATCC 25577]|uniref:Aminobenzoyl-glutamate transporter n=1 Tax=Cutibacterium avidum ATCC 25577 TaxID=997355 RepID=G4D0B2_9ACTN|nr:aminobenzoyl-glutamate transporter [Cutibacterium avidum ATCC 25577]